jgi:hypothetical protein
MKYALIATLILCAACDPASPSASGTLFLDSDINPNDFKTLYVRGYPSPNFSLTVTDLEGAQSLPLMVLEAVADISFPYEYHPVTSMGMEDQPRYQIYAWLSKDEPNPEQKGPKKGDAYGDTFFEAKKCGALKTNYCGETKGVDITIERIAP